MYTEYNSSSVYQQPENYENEEKPNKFFGVLWKILLVILVLVLLVLTLIKFGVISLKSDVAPDAILLNQNEIGIKKGSGYQLVSTVLPDDANNKQVIWTSSDESVVEVNEVTGYIKGLKVGTAIVSVKTLINDVTSECIVNVTDKNVLMTTINVNEKNISLAVGYTHNLTYRTTPASATELSVNFTSSDPSVATVNSKGVIKGIKEGNAVITISSANGKTKDTAYVSVYKKGVTTVVNGESVKTENYPKTITLNEDNLSLKLGTTSQLIASVNPGNANSKVSWSSSNSNIVTVDQNGLVTAKGIGTATVVARTVNNLLATCRIVVGNYSMKLKSILITTEYSVIPIGRTKQLVVAFTPSNASNKTITWSSSNPSVATIDSSGIVKTLSQGSTIITAKALDGGYTSTSIIEVIGYEEIVEEKSISFANNNYSIGVGSSINLNPIITPTNATFRALDFESSDSSVASVDINGVVTGLKEGEALITATTKRNNLKATVVVNVKLIPSTGISLNTTNISINKGDTYTLVATVTPSNASNKSVTFQSDNPNIATIDNNGIITAIEKGATTINVIPNGGGKASTCLVTIK